MKRAIFALAFVAATLVGEPVLAQVQTAPVPIVLPKPPAVTNQASSAIFDAMLAISRAQQTNPQAAQNASFQYAQALQQYRIGNVDAARRSALQSLSTASQPAFPANVQARPPAVPIAPVPAQIPGLQGGLYGADAAAIDADSFLALARGLIADCAARHDRRLATAQGHYAQAARDFAARNWQATRMDAKAAIDACAQRER